MFLLDFFNGSGLFEPPYPTDLVCDSFNAEYSKESDTIFLTAIANIGGVKREFKFMLMPQTIKVTTLANSAFTRT